jgi:hypothetical protein
VLVQKYLWVDQEDFENHFCVQLLNHSSNEKNNILNDYILRINGIGKKSFL